MFGSETYEIIKDRILNNMELTIDKREGSFVSNMVSPVGVEFAKSYMELDMILKIAFLEDSFDEYLDRKVKEFGVERKLGEYAQGEVLITGTNGIQIPINSIVISETGLRYKTLHQGSIDGDSATVVVEAEEVGSIYNILANSEFVLATDISGVEAITNVVGFTGGIDVETDEELRERFFRLIRRPATSGNVYHYEQWALEVDGVGNVEVKPLWNGAGTVKVIVTDTQDNPVTPEIVTSCIEYIEEVRPIGASVTVITPTILDISVVATLDIDVSYNDIDVKIAIEKDLVSYLSTCETSIVFNKVASIIGACAGVTDYSGLTLNGGTSSIAIPDEHKAKLKSLVLS